MIQQCPECGWTRNWKLVDECRKCRRCGTRFTRQSVWQAWASLAVRGAHIVVRKEGGCPRGRDHINGIESLWSYAKHLLYPCRGVHRKFFHLYLGEACYRFNHRAEHLVPLVLQLMKRLDYADLRPLLIRKR